MKAVQCHTGKLTVVEVEPPAAGPGQLMLDAAQAAGDLRVSLTRAELGERHVPDRVAADDRHAVLRCRGCATLDRPARLRVEIGREAGHGERDEHGAVGGGFGRGERQAGRGGDSADRRGEQAAGVMRRAWTALLAWRRSNRHAGEAGIHAFVSIRKVVDGGIRPTGFSHLGFGAFASFVPDVWRRIAPCRGGT